MHLKEAILFATKRFKTRNITSASLDAEVLLLETLNRNESRDRDRSWMYLHLEEYALSPEEETAFRAFVKRREKDEPIAYITNKKEFYGLDFFVDKNVLIPRPETEVTVDNSLEALRANPQKDFTIMDIGTGSGCIIISLLDAAKRSGLNNIKKVFADDISEEALGVARSNAKRHRLAGKITFLRCDLAEALPKLCRSRNVIVTANLPYISADDYAKLGPSVKRYEPRSALTAGENGLCHINRLLATFAIYSRKIDSFHLFLEADPKQMRTIEKTAKRELKAVETRIICDIRNKKRVIEIFKK